MTEQERQQRLAEIRRRLDTLSGGTGRLWVKSFASTLLDDARFLLAELDAACAAIADLREESAAYRRGFAEGAAAEREQILDLAEDGVTGMRLKLIRPDKLLAYAQRLHAATPATDAPPPPGQGR